MTDRLNQRAFDHAIQLIEAGSYVLDERDLWSEHQPSSEKESAFIKDHGFSEYAKWHLGLDADEAEDTKQRYKFPYGTSSRGIGAAACPPKHGLGSTTIMTVTALRHV